MTRAVLTSVGPQGATHTADLWAYLTPELRQIVRTETDAWIKRLRTVRYGSRTMRERFLYRQDSLWWFTELFLHRARRLELAVATMVALDSARSQHAPARIAIETSHLVIRDAAHTYGRTRRLPVETRGAQITRDRHARTSYLTALTSTLAAQRPRTPIFLPSSAIVAAFIQTSFAGPTLPARPRLPSFVPQVLDALAARVDGHALRCVGIGPRRNLRRRSGHAIVPAGTGLPITPIEQLVPQGQLSGSLDIWRRRADLAQQLTAGDEIRAAGRVREYDLWAILHRELEAVAFQQWPWSARAMDEAAAALSAIKPERVVTYDETSAWGRALILEARRRQSVIVAIPHELTRSEFLMSHEPDEIAASETDGGFPLPDHVLVFDQTSARRLEEMAHIPAPRITITGHPRNDGLRITRPTRLTDDERLKFQRELGVVPDQRLAVLVARMAELGSLLPALLDAVRDRRQVHLAIKIHPADASDLYRALSAAASNIQVVPDTVELGPLLAAADGLITRESTVAVDALSIGVPSMILGTPDHLEPLVDAGIMLGVVQADAVGAGIDALLYDDQVRKRLRRVVGARSAGDERATARAADRAAEAILELRHPS